MMKEMRELSIPENGGLTKTFAEDDWDKLVELFLNSQDIMDKSRETYRWGLKRFFKWMKATGRTL
jgi:hypothetical protein